MAEYEDKQKLAVELAVHWAKTGLRQFSMRDAVNDYMKEVGANKAITDESIIDRRRICAQQLTIRSIAFLSKDELHKVEQELKRIAEDDAPKHNWAGIDDISLSSLCLEQQHLSISKVERLITLMPKE